MRTVVASAPICSEQIHKGRGRKKEINRNSETRRERKEQNKYMQKDLSVLNYA
jgi:hypothetical protein